MDLQIFQDFYQLGISVIPVKWDTVTNLAKEHPIGARDGFTLSSIEELLKGKFSDSNAIAICVNPPLGMVDFDVKNTTNKKVFEEWRNMVEATNPDLLRKTCIEKTRSNGYHVYFKYKKLSHKIPVAREADTEGKPQEVISIYTGGLLSYCSPTPKYEIIHNDWSDIDFITDEEFDLIVSCGAYFNKYEELASGESAVAFTSYPTEYESTCLQFDNKLTDDAYEALLNSITLYKCENQNRYKKKGYIAYLRKGSSADYSAKVYWRSRKLLIFSGSMSNFPTWADSQKMGDKSWSLTPSKIVYYKNNRDWAATIEEINCICDSANIEIQQPRPITETPIPTILNDGVKFPFDIFPDVVNNFIQPQTIQHEYLAAAILIASASAIGNSVQLEAIEGYIVKPVFYLALVAPPGASKSPAMKKAFAPLEKYDAILYEAHKEALKEYGNNLAQAKKDKSTEPEKPVLQQVLIKDSTIEMVIKILSHNKFGCCVYADELDGFLRRMNQYKDGDEVQKWLELWSGSPILLQRISRDENKVQEPVCSICGGIQPGVLENLSKDNNQHNGFFHRFLFCFPTPQEKPPFAANGVPSFVVSDYYRYFERLLNLRQTRETYILTDSAFTLYKSWFDYKNTKYNKSYNDNVKGIIAKYQDYCLRFAILIQVMNEQQPMGMVDHISMNGAIRLTEYFFMNMHKALKLLSPESPIDRLPLVWKNVYEELPHSFSSSTFEKVADKYGIKPTTARSYLQRLCEKPYRLLEKLNRGEYEKCI